MHIIYIITSKLLHTIILTLYSFYCLMHETTFIIILTYFLRLETEFNLYNCTETEKINL